MHQERSFTDPFSLFLKEHPQQGQRALDLDKEGQDLLNSGKLKQAERKFREALAVCECAIPALNNLALCFQLRGDAKRAIRTAHKALDFYTEDVFTHCTLAECYQEMGQPDKAQLHMDRAMTLLEDPDIPLDKLPKVIEALAQLQQDEKIIEIYRSYHEGIGFEGVMDGISWFYLGVAKANLGLTDDALSLWERAVQEDSRIKLAELYTSALQLVREKKVPRFHFVYRTEAQVENLDPKHPSEGIKPVVATGMWSEQQDDDYRDHLVALLGIWEDAWAEEFLRLIILRPDLPDQLKIHAATALIDRGAIAEDEPVEMFMNGKRRFVVIKSHEISAPPPPEAVKQFEIGLARRQAGDMKAAERAYCKALEIDPDFAEVMVNLANIYRGTDRTDEAAELLERAIELTGSPTAILNLAALYILEQGLIEEGEDLISLLDPDDIDEGLKPMYYRIIGHLDVYSGAFDHARDTFNKLISLQPGDETARDLLDWVGRAEAMRNYDLARWKQRRARYLRQPVDPQMPLAMALHSLTKDNMIGIAHWYDISYGNLSKAELAQMLSDYLQHEDTDIWADLSAEARDALEFLYGAGGSVPLAKLEEKFGSTGEDSIDWRYRSPESVIGELQISAIVFVGTDTSGEIIAFIPNEMFQRMP